MKKLFLFLLLATSPVFGTIRFTDGNLSVDCVADYSIASRDCSGADGAAYVTLLDGIANTSAGDILEVRAGTYAEELDTVDGDTINNGTAYDAANVVHIRAYLSEVVNWTAQCSNCFITRIVAVSYVIFENFVMDGTGQNDTLPCLNTNNSTHHIRWKGNEIKLCGESGIEIASSLSASHHLEFINGSFHDNGKSHCIYNRGNNLLIDGVEFYNCFTVGIWNWSSSGNGNDTIIRNSTFHDASAGGGSRAEIDIGAGTDIQIYNNIFYNCSFAAIQNMFGASEGGTTDLLIYNNTIYDCRRGITIDSSGNGTVIRNNIIWSDTVARVWDISDGGTGTITTTNLLNTDALFTAKATQDFSLTSGSPAVDTGTGSSSVFTSDFNQTIVRNDEGLAWDIGAFELDQTPPVPDPGCGDGTVTFVSAQDVGLTTTTTHTLPNMVVSSGSNRFLICAWMSGSTNEVASGVFNTSESFTQVPSALAVGGSSTKSVDLWYLINPSNVTADVVFTTNNITAVTACAEFTSVHQTTPLGTAAVMTSTNDTTPSVSPTGGDSSGMGFAAMNQEDEAPAQALVDSGQTERTAETVGTTQDAFTSTEDGAAAAMGWNNLSTFKDMALSAVPILPSAGGACGAGKNLWFSFDF